MRTRIAAFAALSLVCLTLAAAGSQATTRRVVVAAIPSQATNPPYLGQMPSIERVTAEVKGADAMDTAARQMGAFWQLIQIIRELAGQRLWRNQLTSDEGRLLGQYRLGYSTAEQPYAHIPKSPSHPDKEKWFKAHTFYENDPGFRDELLDKFFTEDFRAAYYRATGKLRSSSRPRGNAPTTRPTAQPSTSAGGSAEAYMAEGKKYAKANEWTKAAEAFQKAVALNPNLKEAHFYLGVCYSTLKRYQDALAQMKEAVRLGPSDYLDHFQLGVIYYHLERHEKALSSLQQSLRLKPDFAETHYWLGSVYTKGFRRYEDALSEFREALRLNPDLGYASRDLGAVYYLLKQYPQAVESLQRAIRLKPDDAGAYLHLGRTYLAMGRKDDALQVYRTLLTLNKEKAQSLYAEINEGTSSQPAATGGNSARANPPSGVAARQPRPTQPTGQPVKTPPRAPAQPSAEAPAAVKRGEYTTPDLPANKVQLDVIALELKWDPDALAHIIAYGGRTSRLGEAKAAADKAKDYLVDRHGIDEVRIMTVDGGYRGQPSVELWIVPSGASPPAPTPTVDPKDVRPARRPAAKPRTPPKGKKT